MVESPSNESVSTRLGMFYADLGYEDVSVGDRNRLRMFVVDVLASCLAGVAERQHEVAADMARSNGGATDATPIGVGTRYPAETAAFVNATTAHAIVQDDAHRSSGTHPGVMVVPTALAVGEAVDAHGAELLTAMLAGYDVVGRLGRVRRGFNDRLPRRPSPVFGPIGAAVTAGVLYGQEGDELANAIGYAANLSSGMSQVWVGGTEEYALHCGFAARNGILAAQVADRGLRAAPRTLEGEYGFYRAFFGEVPDVLYRVVDDLGEPFELRDVYSKAEPSCGLAIAPIQLARQLVRDGLGPDNVRSIRLTLSERAANVPGVLHTGPFESPTEALMSAPFGVASTIVLGDYSRAACRDRQDDAEIRSLAKRIKVELDDDFTKYQCSLRVTLSDGETVALSRDAVDEPTVADVEQKFRTHAAGVVDEDDIDDVYRAFAALDEVDDLASITALL